MVVYKCVCECKDGYMRRYVCVNISKKKNFVDILYTVQVLRTKPHTYIPVSVCICVHMCTLV